MERFIKNHGTTATEIGMTNKLTKDEKSKLIQDLIKRIFKKLDEPNQINDESKNYLDNQQLTKTVQSEITYVVDRFEGNYAVCENRENREMINIEISELPANIHEGDILTYKDNVYSIDENKRKEIEERINEKVRNIFED